MNKIVYLFFTLTLIIASTFKYASSTTIESKSVNFASGIEKDPLWIKSNELTSKQQLKEALVSLNTLKEQIKKTNPHGPYLAAVYLQMNLIKIALHGVETALEDLNKAIKEEPWSKDSQSNAIIQILYAHNLLTYFEYYNYEINQRTKTQSNLKLAQKNLKSKTTEEIFQEAREQYENLWENRNNLALISKDNFEKFIIPNSYPDFVKSNFYDTYVHLFVKLLSDTQGWMAHQSNNIYLLSINELINGKKIDLHNQEVHPLTKISYILNDQYNFYKSKRSIASALEAKINLYRILEKHFHSSKEKEKIITALNENLEEAKSNPWLSMGLAFKAEIVLRSELTQNYKREAYDIALMGAKAFPNSDGAKKCRDIIKQIERPMLTMEGMNVDGPNEKNGIRITHANIQKLYFQTYLIDIKQNLLKGKDYNFFPNNEQLTKIIQTKPDFKWEVSLKKRDHFLSNSELISIPPHRPGTYFIFATTSPDGFLNLNDPKNLSSGLFTTFSDVTFSYRLSYVKNEIDIYVQEGSRGSPVQDAKVMIYELNYNSGHKKIAEQKTNRDGMVIFTRPRNEHYNSHLIVVEKDNQFVFNSSGIYITNNYEANSPNKNENLALLYTDRGIYRPGQRIYWKTFIYNRSKKPDLKYIPQLAKDTSTTIELRDANNELISSQKVTTDQYGAAFGEFEIPKGKLLGQWHLQGPTYSTKYFRVEEYKRPNFELAFTESKQPMLLNNQVEISANAKYYFGLPVSKGKYRYKIYRHGVLPLWATYCQRCYWGNYSKEEMIEVGMNEIENDGNINIRFTPKGDENQSLSKQDIKYNFRIELELTDDGGETKTASHNLTIGLVNIQVGLMSNNDFFLENENFKLTLNRTDLSGKERPGTGTITVYQLEEPKTSPEIFNLKPPYEKELFHSKENDKKNDNDERPRFESYYNWDFYAESLSKGKKISEKVTSAENKDNEIELAGLSTGLYRAIYNTKDDFGNPIQTQKNFIIAGEKSNLKIPLFIGTNRNTGKPGSSVKLFLSTGFEDQEILLEKFQNNKLIETKNLKGSHLINIDLRESDRGGFSYTLNLLRHFQNISLAKTFFVPWDNKELLLHWSTFRNKIRPGTTENWTLTLKTPDAKHLKAKSSQVLAYMYDRSLDFFNIHDVTNPINIFPNFTGYNSWSFNLGQSYQAFTRSTYASNEFSNFSDDRINYYFSYGVGGMGVRRQGFEGSMAFELGSGIAASSPALASTLGDFGSSSLLKEESVARKKGKSDYDKLSEMKSVDNLSSSESISSNSSVNETAIRNNFNETAFWKPNLTNNSSGEVKIDFLVPDSLTSWNVWALAVTDDLQSGLINTKTESIKEIMIRPYLPRYFREGDLVEFKLVINNATKENISGNFEINILDMETKENLNKLYQLKIDRDKYTFASQPLESDSIKVSVQVPNKLRPIIIITKAKTKNGFSDGEQREIPIIPGRIHLAQSKFKVLKDQENIKQTIKFEDLINNKDKDLINEKMVITLDGQLFYSVLSSLPYLINYPYECVEQTLNRFVSTGILSSLFHKFPAIAKMSEEFSKRSTPLAPWNDNDPNRKISLEETPWLQESKGYRPSMNKDSQDTSQFTAILHPKIAASTRDYAINALSKSQTSLGAFPWFPGGAPSPYMTLYVLYGLSKAIEFGIDVPKPMIQKAWSYMKRHYVDHYINYAIEKDVDWEEVTFLNYVLSNYNDPSWTSNIFSDEDRKTMANFSFKHWKEHSPYLKGQLVLTLNRMKRSEDSKLIWRSIIDSATTTPDEGTHWQIEDRSWLWYNDTIETQAFALRVGSEVETKKEFLDGIVQWLFLNKKLNHWKSTRATAEVIYSLAHYLNQNKTLANKEKVKVVIDSINKDFEFSPEKYTGAKNQMILTGDQISPKAGEIEIQKTTPGIMFAQATWHFSTLTPPKEARGDFLSIDRQYFKRTTKNKEIILIPLANTKDSLVVGDEVEVHLSIKTKHPMEYVHLRDPRPAGFEPQTLRSEHKWNLGINWYEEVRDSGTNFFFERLPHGEYTFKYQLRVTNSGSFAANPATISPIYAPEFTAYSSGTRIEVK